MNNNTKRELLKTSLINVSGDKELAERILVFIGMPKPKNEKTIINHKGNLLKKLWEKMRE